MVCVEYTIEIQDKMAKRHQKLTANVCKPDMSSSSFSKELPQESGPLTTVTDAGVASVPSAEVD